MLAAAARRSEIWYSPSKFRSSEANFHPAGHLKPQISSINACSVSLGTDSDSTGHQKWKITSGLKITIGKTSWRKKLKPLTNRLKTQIILTRNKPIKVMLLREMTLSKWSRIHSSCKDLLYRLCLMATNMQPLEVVSLFQVLLSFRNRRNVNRRKNQRNQIRQPCKQGSTPRMRRCSLLYRTLRTIWAPWFGVKTSR